MLQNFAVKKCGRSKVRFLSGKKKAEIAKHQGRFKNWYYLLSRQLLSLSSVKIAGEGNFFPLRARNNCKSCSKGHNQDLGTWKSFGGRMERPELHSLDRLGGPEPESFVE